MDGDHGTLTTTPAPAGLTVATGLFGDLELPPGSYDPAQADIIRQLAARAADYVAAARGEGTRRTYRSAWRQYTT